MARIWFVAAIAAAVQAAVSRDGNHAPVSGRQHALRMRGGAWGRARSRDRHGGGEPERGLEACRERGGADFPAGNADEVERQLRRRLHVNELDLAAALYLGDVLHLVRNDADGAAACFEPLHTPERPTLDAEKVDLPPCAAICDPASLVDNETRRH